LFTCQNARGTGTGMDVTRLVAMTTGNE